MKKIALLLFLLPLAVSAQFNKGQLFLGGSLTAQNQNIVQGSSPTANSGNSGTFGMTPRIGYFLNEKWALGGTLGYVSSFYKNAYHDYAYSYDQKSESSTLSASFFGRRYFTISEKFFFVLDGSLGFGRGNITSNSSTVNLNGGPMSTFDEKIPSYSVTLAVRPLFIFFPSPKWGIETGLGSLSFSGSRNLTNHSGTNSFGLGALGTLSLGVNYYFKRK